MEETNTIKANAIQEEKCREQWFQIQETIRRERFTGTVLVMISANQGGIRGLETGKVNWIK